MKFTKRRWYRFDYPNYGSPDCHPDYTAHSGMAVRIVRSLRAPEERDIDSELSFIVKARDGWQGTALASELSTKRPRKTPQRN